MAQLAGNSGIPEAASRFAAAQPGKKPTLVLDKNFLDFGKAVHTKGAMSQCRGACRTWKIAGRKGVALLMPHWVSTKENVGADFLSRHNLNSWEIKLDVDLFQLLLDHFHLQPTLDAFASSKTNQLPRYMSWKEDSSAVGRNALMP